MLQSKARDYQIQTQCAERSKARLGSGSGFPLQEDRTRHLGIGVLYMMTGSRDVNRVNKQYPSRLRTLCRPLQGNPLHQIVYLLEPPIMNTLMSKFPKECWTLVYIVDSLAGFLAILDARKRIRY